MKRNEYGMALDHNGYSASIIQDDMTCCYFCQRRDTKLDRHEVLPASNRAKSKAYGIWVLLCHDTCHEGPCGVHQNAELGKELKRKAQEIAQNYYGWDEDEFRQRFGKSYL